MDGSAVNGASTSGLAMSNGGTQRAPLLRILPKLSEREVQILNGLMKGYANKVIARRYDLAEATVKVHIKSILRKIRVGNRTQAAVWALENGYAAHDFKGSPVEADIESNQITGANGQSKETRSVRASGIVTALASTKAALFVSSATSMLWLCSNCSSLIA